MTDAKIKTIVATANYTFFRPSELKLPWLIIHITLPWENGSAMSQAYKLNSLCYWNAKITAM